MATNNKLKAYVRYDGDGRVIAGSLILQRFKPKVGNWNEIDANECCNDITTTTTTSTTAPPAFRLMFTNINFAKTLVGNVNNVNNWNTYFDLPTLGTPFTSVQVIGSEVNLRGGADITLKASAFQVAKGAPSYLISVNDQTGVITELQNEIFSNQLLLTTVSLPQSVTISFNCFNTCTSLITILLSSCTDLGSTVGNNQVFSNIIGNTVQLTVPTALMTCNVGNPDGDIQYLQANNTVTITTI